MRVARYDATDRILIRTACRAELLIHSYFNIVKREMIDMVPKAISLTLVSFSKENLQRELLQELYKPEVLDELLKESDFVVARRKELQTMVQALNKAEEYVISSYFGVIYNMLLTCLSLFASLGLCPAYKRFIPAFPFSRLPLFLAHCTRNPPHALSPLFHFQRFTHFHTSRYLRCGNLITSTFQVL